MLEKPEGIYMFYFLNFWGIAIFLACLQSYVRCLGGVSNCLLESNFLVSISTHHSIMCLKDLILSNL
jgi:hypothetical protein